MKGYKKMKNIFKTSLVVLAALSLAGCGKTSTSNKPSTGSGVQNSANSNASPSTKPSTPSTKPSTPETHTLSLEVNGTLKVGEVVTLFTSLDDSPLTKDEASKVTFAANPADALTFNGNKATCNKAGEVTITATYKTYTATKKIVIEEGIKYQTVNEVRDLATANEYKEVYVKGRITATSGTSAYLQDTTGGIFIYNFYFQTTDTACKSFQWQVGTNVEIHSYVTKFYGNPQLTYGRGQSGTDLEGRYANLSEDTFEVETADLNETTTLTANDTGKLYKFTAEYQSGTVINNGQSTLNFKLGQKNVKLLTDGSNSKKKAYDKNIDALIAAFNALGLNNGDKVDIVAPLKAVSDSALEFSYFSRGTSITKHIEKDVLSIAYDGELKVGNTLTFSASYNGVEPEGVVYTATKGADLVTITGNKVLLKKAGDVTIKATYSDNGTEKTDEVSFTIASAEPVKINTIEVGKQYIVRGKVNAVTGQGFVLSDETGNIYCQMGSGNVTVNVGDFVEVEGEVSDTFHGMIQFSKPEVKRLDTPITVPEVAAIEMTKEIADGFVRTKNKIEDTKKYKWETTISKDGNFFLLNFAGSSTKIEYAYYTGTLEEGKTYTLEAYFIGYDTKYNYATMAIVSATKKAATEVSVKLDKTAATVDVGSTVTLTAAVELPADKTDNTVTWTSDNETIATVENGVVTGVKAGITTIKATSNADNTKFAEATITVTTPAAPGETDSVTITFDNDFNKGFEEISKTKMKKTVGDITIEMDKANSKTDIAVENNALKYIPLRVYKGMNITFTSKTSKIVSATTVSGDSSGKKKFNNDNAACENSTITDNAITLNTASLSFTVSAANSQIILSSIELKLAVAA